MNIRFFATIFFLALNSTIFGQSLQILTTPEAQDGDTLNFCQDSSILLLARQIDSLALDSSTLFEWNYGNNVNESGTDLDSVTISYTKGGAYFIRLRAITLNQDTLYATKFLRIGVKPYFTDTRTSADTASICFDGQNNDLVDLTAKVIHLRWKYEFPYQHKEAKAIEINSGKPYIADIQHEVFGAKQKIQNLSEIDTVGILIEHSNAQDIEISLICPNGKSVKLKNFGTKKDFMGEPVANSSLDTTQGTPYWYYFTGKAPNYGTMLQEEQQHFNSYTDKADSTYINEPYYPQGSYLPAESFSGLIGCPYNGKWTIAVVDNSIPDNGYIKAWQLIFDSIPPLKSFINTDSSYRWQTYSSARIIGDSSLLTAKVEPLKANTFAIIKFNLIDDYACPYDTGLIVDVQQASFTAEPPSGDLDLDVQFTNTTRWQNATYQWDFGDGNTAGDESNPKNTYTEKGNYNAILTVTSPYGCINKDTLVIKVTAPVSSIETNNVFTPNGDGVNDFFTFKTSGLRTAHLYIYSRWGERVAELKSLDEVKNGWDGTIKNNGRKKVAPGLYFYTLIAEGKDEVQHKKSGSIHVFYTN